MANRVRGPIEIVESSGQASGAYADDLVERERERLQHFAKLVSEPPIDDLPTPVNLQGLYRQTVEEAETKASDLVATARENATQIELETKQNAEQTIAEAKAQAEEIIAEGRKVAEEEAIEIKENAHKIAQEEGHQEGLERGQKEGFETGQKEGWEQGYKEGWEQGHHEYQSAIEQVKNLSIEFVEQQKLVVEKNESELIGLVFDIANKVVHHEVATDSVVYHTVKELMHYLSEHEHVIIQVNPDDVRSLEPHQDEFLQMAKGINSIKIEENPEIERGGCQIETNLGSIDARIDAQFAGIMEALNINPDRNDDEKSKDLSQENLSSEVSSILI